MVVLLALWRAARPTASPTSSAAWPRGVRRRGRWPSSAAVGASSAPSSSRLVVPGDPPPATWRGVRWPASAAARDGVPLPRAVAGRMGVVAPVSGVGAACPRRWSRSPTGERPSRVWVGIVVAVPGIWLVEPGAVADAGGRAAAAWLDGVLAGARLRPALRRDGPGSRGGRLVAHRAGPGRRRSVAVACTAPRCGPPGSRGTAPTCGACWPGCSPRPRWCASCSPPRAGC